MHIQGSQEATGTGFEVPDFVKFGSEYFSGIANVLEIIGFAITILGFGFSLFFSWRSKRAAEQARDAAQVAQQRLLGMANFGDLETATAVLEETMRLLRQGAAAIALDRLTIVKRDLSKIKANSQLFNVDDQITMQSATTQVSMIMNSIEIAVANPKKPIDVPRLNGLLSDEIAKLSALKSNFRTELVR